VTGVVGGLSTVIIDDQAPKIRSTEIWMTTPDERLGAEPDERVLSLDPPSGTTIWRMVSLPPYEELRAALAANPSRASTEKDCIRRERWTTYSSRRISRSRLGGGHGYRAPRRLCRPAANRACLEEPQLSRDQTSHCEGQHGLTGCSR
jgi:hypothetical protein